MHVTHDVAADDVCARPLKDEDLTDIAGGGQSGGPVCPLCGSYNIVFDRKTRTFITCNNCGFYA